MLLDNIVDEIQQSKVSYSVNGYVNLLHTDDANPDMALMFFRTLSQLSDLDIRVLRLYDYAEATETAYDVLDKVKAKIAELDYWTDKQETKAEVDTLNGRMSGLDVIK